MGAAGPEKRERRETAGEGCSPLGVRKCLGESQEGAPGNPFLQPHKGPGPNYTSLSLPYLPSATPINLKLEAWLLQSLSWGWQERSQTGKLRYRGACSQVQQLSGEEKGFPQPSITLRIRLNRVEFVERRQALERVVRGLGTLRVRKQNC